MVHRNTDEGHQQPKPRGRPRGKPFPKGYTPPNKGKSNTKVLDDSGRESGNIRATIAPDSQSSIVGPKEEEITALAGIKQAMTEITDALSKEPMQEVKTNEEKDVIVDQVDFMNGDNKLSIRFTKKHNRMFRIQVFLNEENEIRPVTYTGASTGYAFWNLLKGAIRK